MSEGQILDIGGYENPDDPFSEWIPGPGYKAYSMRQRLEKLLPSVGIKLPVMRYKKFTELSSEDKYVKHAVEGAKSWLQQFVSADSNNRGLLLEGNVGSGKTTLAQVLYCELTAVGVEAIIVSAEEVCSLLRDFEKNQWQKINQSAVAELDRLLRSCPVLILDDVGREKIDYCEFLALLVNLRYDKSLSTVITTNLSLDTVFDRERKMPVSRFLDRYGDRVDDRLQEFFRVKCLAQSFRRR